MGLSEFEFKIETDDSPILHMGTEEMDTEYLKEEIQFLGRMFDFMRQSNGVGLAAPQIGLPLRFFIMQTPEMGTRVCLNPRLLTASQEEDVINEGCLSFPGLRLSLRRPSVVEVEYHDHRGVFYKQTLQGFPARVFQHELDHLNGVVFSDLASETKLRIAKTKVRKNLKKMKKAGRL